MLYRTSVADSWRWMRLDLVVRLIPLTAAPLLFSWLTRTPLSTFGLTLAHPLRDLLVALVLGAGGFLVAAGFAEYLARRNRRWFVPDSRDLAVQSSYYLLLNAPIEEWFFRGFLQGGLTTWLKAPAIALLVTTAVFGGYHFLDRWGWRPVLGATAAGLTLGLIYLWQPSPSSLLAPTLVHAAITCGFLSLGPYAIYRWRLARRTLRPIPEPVRE
ncbi:MAG TPA: CPBP family intramembrane glutamic endopeptidase [Candidatus Angelobacter sp.]|nr:CPBP family intramembrane glutamic endopeptidase [Candidatus Angelobacter sp.]